MNVVWARVYNESGFHFRRLTSELSGKVRKHAIYGKRFGPRTEIEALIQIPRLFQVRIGFRPSPHAHCSGLS